MGFCHSAVIGRSVSVRVRDEDGREVQRTHDGAENLSPVWSPDGIKIAFETQRDGNSEIYVMNTNGTDQIRLTFAPSLSFASLRSAGDSGLVFSRIEGDSNGDGLIEVRGMATFFCLDPERSAAQSCWRRRTIFDQMVFRWGRRMAG
ncbi:MAG: hypothetical protein CEE40_04845 [Chloroflexi bacterium B3_Chlor]|nr:MAG: hypothetical protein CEE40_04845 [Chloroflexi bacterium B3_Chlor]